MKAVDTLILGVMLSIAASSARAWDNFKTHPELANSAVLRLGVDSSVERYLTDDLQLPAGFEETLALRKGMDSATDGYFERLRFDRDLSLLHWLPFDRADDDVRIEFNDLADTDPATFDVRHLIRSGTFAEDVPNPRARHHFLDPEKLHLPPAGNRGLNNNSRIPILDMALAELVTAGRGGNLLRAIGGVLLSPLDVFPTVGINAGNFGFRGRSALDRALNRFEPGINPPSEEAPESFFALPDAERYLFRALTASQSVEREHFLALHLLTVGQVLHLLQDMAVPAHVRNDFVVDHLVGRASLEKAGRDGPRSTPSSALGLIARLGDPSEPLTRSRPYEFLAEGANQNGLPAGLLAAYAPAIRSLDPSGFEVADFWGDGRHRSETDARWGLAELVNQRFFSRNTISNDTDGAFSVGYVAPAVIPAEAQGAPGSSPVWSVDLSRRGRDGAVDDPGRKGRFLSTALVPHLASCRFHCAALARASASPSLMWTVAEDSVERDYLELLFPLVIDYSVKFMQAYFTPRIDVVAVGDNRFKLMNRTQLPLRFDRSAVEVAYDGIDPENSEEVRAGVAVNCSSDSGGGGSELLLPAAPSASVPGEPGSFTCSMPAAVSIPAKSRGSFWVIVRGQNGERGHVGTPSEFDAGSKDFVVAFHQVHGWQLAMHHTSALAPESEPATDENRAVDVVTLGFDLDAALRGEEPSGSLVNRTAALRERIRSELGEAVAAQVDFMLPSAEPGSTRIAFGGDVLHDRGIAGLIAPSEHYIVDLLDPGAFTEVLPPAGLQPAVNFVGGPKWNRQPGAGGIYYSANPDGDGESATQIVRYDAEAAASSVSPVADGPLIVSSVYENRAAVLKAEGGFDLQLADATSARSTHRFDVPDGVVEACPATGACGSTDSKVQLAPQFSADGSKVVFVDVPQLGSVPYGRLMVTDLSGLEAGSVSIQPLSGAVDAADPAWSPDGAWIAYEADDGLGIFVIQAAGGTPVRVSRTSGRSLTWLPALLLPQ